MPKKIPDTNYRLIAVASQVLGDQMLFDIKEIEDTNGDVYYVKGHYTYSREEIKAARETLTVALGQEIDPELIFNVYKDSRSVIIFIGLKKG